MSNQAAQKTIREMEEKIWHATEKIIVTFLEDPHCLNGQDQERKNIRDLAILYFQNKRSRTSNPKADSYATYPIIYFSIAMDELEDAPEEEKLRQAIKLTKKVTEARDVELRMVPDEMKDKLFELAISCIEKIC